MNAHPRWLVVLLLLAGCPAKTDPEAKGGPATTSTSTPAATQVPPSKGSADEAKASSGDDAPAGKFVRARPDGPDRKGIDACAYLGGFGFACIDALLAEKDPIVKRYMRRLSDADARQAKDALNRNEPGGVAHAEFSLGCADTGPCAAKPETSDDGYFCLTKAEILIQEKKVAASKAAHERACKCGAVRASIPVMGGFLACDGAKAVERGNDLTTEEAAEIRACGECDPEKGHASCAREIERLGPKDAELARYLKEVHVPRCQKP